MTENHRPAGRRERKKLGTREALRPAAARLFREQGVAATSIEQIADAADVSPRTFFRYFESKYDLVLPDLAALFAAIEAALADRPSDEHLLESYRAAVAVVLAEQAAAGVGLTTLVPGLDPTDPAVLSRLLQVFVAWEARLTALFAQRLRDARPGRDDDVELRAAVTAGAAVAGTRAVLRVVRGRPDVAPPERMRLLCAAFDILCAGCVDDPDGFAGTARGASA